MSRLLYVRECQHGRTLDIIAVPEGSTFSDPKCTYANRRDQRPHIALATYYREATDMDFFTPKVPRKTRSDKGQKRVAK